MIGINQLEWIKLAIYYASYFYFVAAPLLVWLAVKYNGPARAAALLALAPLSALAYARFIEPRILLTVEHEVELENCFDQAGAVRIAAFSDIHRGLFGNAMTPARIARRVDVAEADLALIAGDFVYYLHPERFEETFAPLAEIDAPVFGVLGNHDLGIPGPDVSAALMETLPGASVRLIDNEALKLSGDSFTIELVGVSDHWDRRQQLSLLRGAPDALRIVLTHNATPTAKDMSDRMRADLIIGGHTHGGQIYLPGITCAFTGACGAARYGLSRANGTQVFTTSGTGMVGLPMRFAVAPRVDVLNVRYKACSAL